MNAFQKVVPEEMKWNGSYLFEDSTRGTLIRAGTSEQEFDERMKTHRADSFLRKPLFQQRRLYHQWYQDRSIFQEVEGRKGVFQDIHQRVWIGMDRNNRDETLSLFGWSEEEKKQLRMLPWKSSYKDSLANRKYRHLCCLFEAVYAIALKHQTISLKIQLKNGS